MRAAPSISASAAIVETSASSAVARRLARGFTPRAPSRTPAPRHDARALDTAKVDEAVARIAARELGLREQDLRVFHVHGVGAEVVGQRARLLELVPAALERGRVAALDTNARQHGAELEAVVDAHRRDRDRALDVVER